MLFVVVYAWDEWCPGNKSLLGKCFIGFLEVSEDARVICSGP
jgi:hypothetical protein